MMGREDRAKKPSETGQRSNTGSKLIRHIVNRVLGDQSIDHPTEIHCGCGEYSIELEETSPIYAFGVVCPECGTQFGWDIDPVRDHNPWRSDD